MILLRFFLAQRILQMFRFTTWRSWAFCMAGASEEEKGNDKRRRTLSDENKWKNESICFADNMWSRYRCAFAARVPSFRRHISLFLSPFYILKFFRVPPSALDTRIPRRTVYEKRKKIVNFECFDFRPRCLGQCSPQNLPESTQQSSSKDLVQVGRGFPPKRGKSSDQLGNCMDR